MCFTINVNTTRKAIEKRFKVDASALIDFQFHYFYRAFDNPLIPVLTQEQPDQIQLMNWGLIPHWAGNKLMAEKIRSGTYNARVESVKQKPSFQEPLETGRCWIVACGFFEWQHQGKDKIPWYISQQNNSLFAFAGLYDKWQNQDTGKEEKTFSIITTRANPLMEKIHNSKKRMPLILNISNEMKWIDDTLNGEGAHALLLENNEVILDAHTVGRKISKPGADPNDPRILDKVNYFVDGKLF